MNKKITSAVWEAGVSRPHGSPIKGPSNRQCDVERFKGPRKPTLTLRQYDTTGLSSPSREPSCDFFPSGSFFSSKDLFVLLKKKKYLFVMDVSKPNLTCYGFFSGFIENSILKLYISFNFTTLIFFAYNNLQLRHKL